MLALQQEWLQFPVTFSAEALAAFATELTNSQHSCHRPPADFTSVCPTDGHIGRRQPLSPSLLPTHSHIPHHQSPGSTPAASLDTRG